MEAKAVLHLDENKIDMASVICQHNFAGVAGHPPSPS